MFCVVCDVGLYLGRVDCYYFEVGFVKVYVLCFAVVFVATIDYGC